MFHCAIIQSRLGNSLKEDFRELKGLISEIEGSPLLVLMENYPDIDSISRVDKGDISQVREEYSEIMDLASGMAGEYSIYLSPGVLLEAEGEGLYFSSLLFNPEGESILKQRQLYPDRNRVAEIHFKIEGEFQESFIKAGKTINYVETELGKIGLISGRDCWHPEIGRVLALENVDIVLAVNNLSFRDSKAVNPWQQIAGIWSQVQQNQFIALEASVGGQNLVHGPCEISPYRTGILAPVGKDTKANTKSIEPYFEDISRIYRKINGFKVISAGIELSRLKSIRSSYPLLKHLNKPLYCKEMQGWGS